VKKSKVISSVMLCDEKGRLLDACVTAADHHAQAVQSLSAVAAKDNRTAFREALAHAEQTRQEAEEARLALHLHSKTHGC
jgi:PIN domain nuclease of toxin-antitoxin system